MMLLTYYRAWMEASRDFVDGKIWERWRKNVPLKQRVIFYCAVLSAIAYIALLLCGRNIEAYIAIAVCTGCLFLLMFYEKSDSLQWSIKKENARIMRLRHLVEQFNGMDVRYKEQFEYLQTRTELFLRDRQRSKEIFQKRAFSVLILGFGSLSISLITGAFGDELLIRGTGIFLLVVVCSAYFATGAIWMLLDLCCTLSFGRMVQFNGDLNDVVLNWRMLHAEKEDSSRMVNEEA